MFKKYANLALVSALLVATVHTCSMEIVETTEIVEQVEVVKAANTPWYKREAFIIPVVSAVCLVVAMNALSQPQPKITSEEFGQRLSLLFEEYGLITNSMDFVMISPYEIGEQYSNLIDDLCKLRLPRWKQ